MDIKKISAKNNNQKVANKKITEKDNEKINKIAEQILKKYKYAFEVLGNGEI